MIIIMDVVGVSAEVWLEWLFCQGWTIEVSGSIVLQMLIMLSALMPISQRPDLCATVVFNTKLCSLYVKQWLSYVLYTIEVVWAP